MFGIEMNATVIGMLCGTTLISLELGMILATTVFRKQMLRRCPRVVHHMSIGVKTTSYRCCAGIDTFIVALVVTGNPMASSAVVGFELMTKFFLYYGHEYVWNTRPMQRFMLRDGTMHMKQNQQGMIH